MKKLCCLLFIIMILVCYVTGCSDSKTNLVMGIYELQEINTGIKKPTLELKENNEFVFTYSALSSYLPIGTYKIDNTDLILKTDDGKNKYIFQIKGNNLVFNEGKSSPVSFGEVTDGAVFAMKDK
jgi:hypothetical protein